MKNKLTILFGVLIGILTVAMFDVSAQPATPGGTTLYQVEYWLKADQLVTNKSIQDGVQVMRWVDAYGKAFAGTAGSAAGTAPSMNYNGMNFQPAVNFATVARRLNSETNFTVTGQGQTRLYRTFYVSNSTSSTQGALFSYTPSYD